MTDQDVVAEPGSGKLVEDKERGTTFATKRENIKNLAQVGASVVFHDERGLAHHALVTAVHGLHMNDSAPCVNLVYVSRDGARTDGYGRQIERRTSVVHGSQQAAGGFYFRFQEETPNDMAEAQI